MNRFTILLFFADAMIRGARRRKTLDGLLRGLKHDHPFARRRAASALTMLSYDESVAAPVLIDALLDSDPHVRQDAALALKRMGPRAIPFLAGEVKVGPVEKRRKLIVLLGLNLPRNPDVRSTLLGALTDREAAVRKAAAWALLSQRSPKTRARRRCYLAQRAPQRRARSKVSADREVGEPHSPRPSSFYARTMRAKPVSSRKSPMALRVSTMSLAF